MVYTWPLTPYPSLSLQGIFSEIDLEGDAQSELQHTELLQNKQTGNWHKKDEDISSLTSRNLWKF